MNVNMHYEASLLVYTDIRDLQRPIEVNRGQMRSLNFPELMTFRVVMLSKVIYGADFDQTPILH